MRGKDSQGVGDQHVYTAVFYMDINKYSTGKLCSMLYGSLDVRGVWGRMDTCVCMAESLWCPPETITTL